MSARGRGAEVLPNEAYPTPAWCVRRMLEVAPWRDGASWPRSPRILEPCAGEGAIVRVLRGAYPSAVIEALEIRCVSHEAIRAAGISHAFIGLDALKLNWETVGTDLCLTNPPFSLWHEFARKGIASARWCALLLRLNAAAHLEDLPTPSLYILPNRPSFVNGRTDACEYAWFVWGPQQPTVHILAKTPLAERKAAA